MASKPTTDTDLTMTVASLGRTPELINELLLQVHTSRWNVRPTETEWSFVENLCHLRDLESEGYAVRIGRILEEEKPFLPDIDGGRLSNERKYIDQDALAALRDFAMARASNVARIAELDAGSLERVGTFENGEAITLRHLIDIIHKHDEEHLGDLSRLCESFSKEGS